MSPDVIGISGLSEIGVRITPGKDFPLSMALNLGGHFGEIKGLDVAFDIEYIFDIKSKEASQLEEKINKKVSKLPFKYDNIKVENTKEGIVVRVDELVFKIESYELTDEGKRALQVVIDEIQTSYPNNKIIVRGHSDNIGELEYNLYLSKERARVIADMMRGRVAQDKLSYEGVADTQPINLNATSQGRAKNRRVEIIIVR